jgi:hypothetical protein
MDKDQLIEMVCAFAESNPNVMAGIMDAIPQPSLQSVINAVTSLEKRLMDSFPYTKWGPSKDDYSFNRVKPHLLELRVSVCAKRVVVTV